MIANFLPASVSFMCKPANPNPSPQPRMIRLSWSGKCSPMPISHSQVQLGTASPANLANSKTTYPAYPALPLSSCRTHTKGSCSYFPHSLCLLTDPATPLCGPRGLPPVPSLLFLCDTDFHACVLPDLLEQISDTY